MDQIETPSGGLPNGPEASSPSGLDADARLEIAGSARDDGLEFAVSGRLALRARVRSAGALFALLIAYFSKR